MFKFNASQKILLISCLFMIYACKNNKDSPSQHCLNTSNLLGKQYLDTKFIDAINAISTVAEKNDSYEGMVLIKGGIFEMGGDFPEKTQGIPKTALPQNDELPKHPVEIADFYMDEHEVTVAQFIAFIVETGYKTVAEYDVDWEELKKQVPPNTPKPADEDLKAGAMVFNLVDKSTSKDNLSNWWTFVKGASWKNPDGKTRDIAALKDYPVTQVSWYDAMAYAKWTGKRLPTEAEFEYAMRGGRKNALYPWGNDTSKLEKGNFLQGEFPYTNTAEDGFLDLAPIGSFPPNDYGLYDIAGNVWEWTNDWYAADYYEQLKEKNKPAINPQGPDKTNEVYAPNANSKVVRGGSFLCHDEWCSGYRNARRMRLSPDSGTQHIGFRLVR